jgi:acetyl esterase/lipase
MCALTADIGAAGWLAALAGWAAIMALAMPSVSAAEAPPERVALWPGRAPVGDGTFQATDAALAVYRPAMPCGAAVVICPGGGYAELGAMDTMREIAEWLRAHGLLAAILEYRLPRGNPRLPLLDAQRAMRLVRANAKAWKCDPRRIGIMGFSAGGHLAAAVGTHFDAGNPRATDPVERIGCRPDFMVLVFPIITMGEATYPDAKRQLLGPSPAAKTVDLFSNERHVTARTPPAFLTHARDDTTVSVENSRMFHRALRAHHVAAEYLEFAAGNHGFNGCKGAIWEEWKRRSLRWLAEQRFIP